MSFTSFKQLIVTIAVSKCEIFAETNQWSVVSLLPSSLQPHAESVLALYRSKSLAGPQDIGAKKMYRLDVEPYPELDVISPASRRGSSGPDDGPLVPSSTLPQDSGEKTDVVRRPRVNGTERRTAAGINVRFAGQGASLVNLSIDRDAITVEDHSFERKVFIDGLTYLLRGLPPDLNACEEDQIRSALPSTMGRQCCTHGEQNPSHGFGGLEQGHGRPALQVVVQKAVVTIVLMYCVLLTLLIALCKLLVRVERKHRISQRLVSQGIALAVSLGRQSESALVSLGEMNDGKVGRTLMGAAAWMVDNVTQGIRDGVGQSLEIITSQSIE